MRRMLSLMEVNLPLYDTELGFLKGDAFHQLPVQQQANALRRCAALQASLGIKGVYFYSHDDSLIGDPEIHPEVAAAIGDIHAMIAGKTLKQVTVLWNGSVRITTAERSFVW